MKAKVKFKKKKKINFILSKTASVRGVSGRYVIAQWFKGQWSKWEICDSTMVQRSEQQRQCNGLEFSPRVR